MDNFLKLPESEQRLYYEQAEARLGLPAPAIEKDFWVCWTLRELFSLPGIGEHLTFKGGTSLSKVWGLIKRFSEDIDLVVDKETLGFGGDESPENAPSKKQRRKRGDSMKLACQTFVHEQIEPALRARLESTLSNLGEWELTADPDDDDRQTLLLTYPSVFSDSSRSYLRPVVIIELGARSDNWPAEEREIRPYVAEAFPEELPDSVVAVRAIQPERTFWEKATLLHEENQRPADKRRNPRLSRHFYDLWAMMEAGIGERAAAELELFERVVEHRQIFFPYAWTDNATMAKGSLRIVPDATMVATWEADYRAMLEAMFFGNPPSFNEVLKSISEFQIGFNQSSAPS